jgi:hypothetical protein
MITKLRPDPDGCNCEVMQVKYVAKRNSCRVIQSWYEGIIALVNSFIIPTYTADIWHVKSRHEKRIKNIWKAPLPTPRIPD